MTAALSAVATARAIWFLLNSMLIDEDSLWLVEIESGGANPRRSVCDRVD